jgi:Bacteriocin-protection, YdeI or OmpD-Associated/Domain of unknown function (DUF1905)
MTPQRFNGQLIRSGSRTVIQVPFDPDEVWGPKARHYVTGSVNGCRFRGKLESDETGFFLALGPAWRRDNGLEAGAKVRVEVQPEGPQSGSLSPDVIAAFDAEPEAQAYFDSLASFYRNNFIRWIESAKRPETRSSRIAQMIEALRAQQRSI